MENQDYLFISLPLVLLGYDLYTIYSAQNKERGKKALCFLVLIMQSLLNCSA